MCVLGAKKCQFFGKKLHVPASNYMLKVNSRNTRTRCEICSKLTLKDTRTTPIWRRVFIVNFEQVNAGWCMIPCWDCLVSLTIFIGLT